MTTLKMKVKESSTIGKETNSIYQNIMIESNRWIELACEEAKVSVERGGGPFGAVILQVDDETNEMIRYWTEHNHVTEFCDPTAHAEISAIRSACHELGVLNLGRIGKQESKLPQMGETSHCEIYCSCEPCPMCYSAIMWARIPVVVFSATRYDAAQPGVDFLDEEIHDELRKDYGDRSIQVFRAVCPNAQEAFELWKKSNNKLY
jgi:guanine deaminase